MFKSYHILVTFNICISQYLVCMFLQVSGDGTGVIYARANSSVEDWGDHFCISYDPQFQALPQEVSQAVSRHPLNQYYKNTVQQHKGLLHVKYCSSHWDVGVIISWFFI